MWLSVSKPRNFVLTFLLFTFLYNQYVMLNVINSLLWILLFFLFTSRTWLLLANHLFIQERTKFDTEQKSSKFRLEIMILVSSTYSTGSDTECILRGGSFVYIMKIRGPRFVPWGAPCFSVPQSEKIFWVVLCDLLLLLLLLFLLLLMLFKLNSLLTDQQPLTKWA